MREIEYRVWHKKEKRMYYFDFWTMTREIPGATSGGFYYPTDGSKMCELTDKQLYSEPMEYTGEKDKNAKKIYDGDIILKDNGTIANVMFYNAGFKFITGRNKEIVDLTSAWHLDCLDLSTWQVVGNICENKELLND